MEKRWAYFVFLCFCIWGSASLLAEAKQRDIQDVTVSGGVYDVAEKERLVLYKNQEEDIKVTCRIHADNIKGESVQAVISGTDLCFWMTRQQGEIWSVSIPRKCFLKEEGSYAVYVIAQDTDDNWIPKVYAKREVIVDHTMPDIQPLEYDIEDKKLSKVNSYKRLFKENVTVTARAKDFLSGLSYLEIIFLGEDGQVKNRKITKKREDILSVVLSGHERGTFRIVARDCAGNERIRNFEPGIIIEKESYHKKISNLGSIQYIDGNFRTVKTPRGYISFANNDVTYQAAVFDRQSGVSKIYYTTDSGTSASKMVYSKNTEETSYITQDLTIKNHHDSYLDDRTSWTNIQISAICNADFFIKTSSGKNTVSDYFVMDGKDPVLAGKNGVLWSNRKKNSKYYQENRELVIDIYEKNFNPDTVFWDITGNKEGYTIGDWDIGKDYHNQCRIIFFGEGEYCVNSVTVQDYAGNRSENLTGEGFGESFLIDKTAPEITISFDEKKPKNGFYFASQREAIVEILEKNFMPECVVCEDGSGGDYQEISWSKSGDLNIGIIPFKKEGTYRLKIKCSDLAGNESAVAVSSAFVIDLTNPVCAITGIEEGKAYSGKVLPVFLYKDHHMDFSSVSVSAIGKENGVLKEISFPEEKSYDDFYTITLAAKDLSGRETKVSKQFILNRYGSDYEFPEHIQNWLEKKYQKEGKTLEVYEKNRSQLKNQKIAVRNQRSDLNELTEGKDYRVYTGKTEEDWFLYHYVIYAANFQKEDTYEVILSSEDEAGNMQNNVIKDIPITFVVDRSDPLASISGLEKKRIHAKEQGVTIRVVENNKLKSAKIYTSFDKKGEEKKLIKSLDIIKVQSLSGESVMVPEKSKRQYVFVVLEDEAGNVWHSEPVSVLITQNVFAEFYDRRMLFLFFGIVSILFTVLLKWRKKIQTLQSE